MCTTLVHQHFSYVTTKMLCIFTQLFRSICWTGPTLACSVLLYLSISVVRRRSSNLARFRFDIGAFSLPHQYRACQSTDPIHRPCLSYRRCFFQFMCEEFWTSQAPLEYSQCFFAKLLPAGQTCARESRGSINLPQPSSFKRPCLRSYQTFAKCTLYIRPSR
jgi:hypothetical protein